MSQTVAAENLLADVKPDLERALVATFGVDLGLEAAAVALAAGWERADRLIAMKNPAGYLYRIGMNFAKRQFTRPPLLPPVDHCYKPVIEPGLPAALAGLSARQRRAVLLVHGYGYSLTEVAALLDISVSSVRNHLGRGMTKLRQELGVHE